MLDEKKIYRYFGLSFDCFVKLLLSKSGNKIKHPLKLTRQRDGLRVPIYSSVHIFLKVKLKHNSAAARCL